MLQIFLLIVVYIELAFCVDFRDVCENEIKPWILSHSIGSKPKPQFDAKDLKFYLYNTDNQELLEANGGNSDKIKKEQNTVFIVHDWFENNEEQWISNLTDQLVTRHGVNVITVDYSKYSNDYYKASVQVIKEIAEEVAKFLHTVEGKGALKIEDTTFVGFGLGAHISGRIGKEIIKLVPDKKLARITGLDPVGDNLFGTSIFNKLQTTDAKFVDVVKTNTDWLGSNDNFGQANFQMNDGKRQPKCEKTKENKLKKYFKKKDCIQAYNLFRCSHLRSTEYWAESVLVNNFVDKKTGTVMGYKGSTTANGEFVIKTRDKPPYGRGG